MKSILTSQGKDLTNYLQKTLVELYEKTTEPSASIDVIRGEILALKSFLREFGVETEIKIELVDNGKLAT